jgi:hypothetical protein
MDHSCEGGCAGGLCGWARVQGVCYGCVCNHAWSSICNPEVAQQQWAALGLLAVHETAAVLALSYDIVAVRSLPVCTLIHPRSFLLYSWVADKHVLQSEHGLMTHVALVMSLL